MKPIFYLNIQDVLFDKILIQENHWSIFIDSIEYKIDPISTNLIINDGNFSKEVDCSFIHFHYLRINKSYPKGYDKSLFIYNQIDAITGVANYLTSNPRQYLGIAMSLRNLLEPDNFIFVYGHEIGHILEYTIYGESKVELFEKLAFSKALTLSIILIIFIIPYFFITSHVLIQDIFYWIKFIFFFASIGLTKFAIEYVTNSIRTYEYRKYNYRKEYFCDRFSQHINKGFFDLDNVFLYDYRKKMSGNHMYLFSHPSSESRLIHLHNSQYPKIPLFIKPIEIPEMDKFYKNLDNFLPTF